MTIRQWLWCATGRVAAWLTWPIICLNVRGSTRTRLLVICGDEVVVTRGWLSDGKWVLPGGGVRKGENLLDAALRELHEETGLRLRVSQLRRHSEHVYRHAGMHFNYVLFIASLRRRPELKPQPLTLAELHSTIIEARWIDRRQLHAGNARSDVLAAVRTRWKN